MKPIEKRYNILIVEPFYADSHKQWLNGFKKYSSMKISALTLPGKFWKWRMHGAAISLANEYIHRNLSPDLIICSSMLDVSLFTSLLRKEIVNIPIALFFHENQISYPWSPDDIDVKLNRDRHYGFLNYSSALTADRVFFNSHYHKASFLHSLAPFLKAFPDYKNIETILSIEQKSEVLHIGLDLKRLEKYRASVNNEIPVIIWNHRWEFDKNPKLFFESLIKLKEEGINFELIIAGKKYARYPKIFDLVEHILSSEIIHWGYAENEEEYHKLLQKADILPVTSNQDFFGISVVEAIYCNVIPLLPNRLAYPEHIDGEEYFYESNEEFYHKLKSLILRFSSRKAPDCSRIVSYDWSNSKLVYDQKFKDLILDYS